MTDGWRPKTTSVTRIDAAADRTLQVTPISNEIFTARRVCIARYMLSCGVCLSVCLSVAWVYYVNRTHQQAFTALNCSLWSRGSIVYGQHIKNETHIFRKSHSSVGALNRTEVLKSFDITPDPPRSPQLHACTIHQSRALLWLFYAMFSEQACEQRRVICQQQLSFLLFCI